MQISADTSFPEDDFIWTAWLACVQAAYLLRSKKHLLPFIYDTDKVPNDTAGNV